jgi:outer membrane receptor for ferrienterochelin and colicins
MGLKLKILTFSVLLLLSQTSKAQVSGKILDSNNKPLEGAVVQYANDLKIGATSDSLGLFILPDGVGNIITTQYSGYETRIDTLATNQKELFIHLSLKASTLGSVNISARKSDNSTSTLNARNVQSISSNELKKAPCCNLSESFETSGAVDVAYTDAVSGAKEIQMLGLRGLYTQMTVENRQALYGLGAPFSLEYIPGTWLEAINISKGTGSVINGYQSITGQINAELVKPGKDKPLFVNLFAEETGRTEINIHLNQKGNGKVSMGLLLHGDLMDTKIDRDGYGFLSMPLKKQLNGMYRLFYTGKKISGQVNVHAITEKRESGQLLPATEPRVANAPFLIHQNTNRLEVFGKLAYMGFDKPYQQLGSQWSATYHNLHALYGRNIHLGTQKSLYANFIYATIFSTTDHKISMGANMQLDDYAEYLNARNLSRTEMTTGLFSEYTYNHEKIGEGYSDWTIIGGLRLDNHNQYGLFVSPRLNIKYNFSENQVLRFVLGRGYRVANPIVENIAYLASNRIFDIAPNLKPEDAINTGINYTHSFTLWKKEAKISIDLYHTQFLNQVVIDPQNDPTKLSIYNLIGKSYSNSALFSLEYEPINGLDLKLVYKYNDVQSSYQGQLEQQPLLPRDRVLVNVHYQTPNKKWAANTTLQWIGQQRLIWYDVGFHDHGQAQTAQSNQSPAYYLLNLQITRKFEKWEAYLGCENLSNYFQHHSILSANDTGSKYFDASQVYAPLMGRRIYVGLRWWI